MHFPAPLSQLIGSTSKLKRTVQYMQGGQITLKKGGILSQQNRFQSVRTLGQQDGEVCH